MWIIQGVTVYLVLGRFLCNVTCHLLKFIGDNDLGSMCHQHPEVVTNLFFGQHPSPTSIFYMRHSKVTLISTPHKDKNVEILHEEDYPVYCYSAFGINNQMALRKLLF